MANEGVEAGDVLTCFFVPDEEEVLPAERDSSQCRLGSVVVRRDLRVAEEARELGPVLPLPLPLHAAPSRCRCRCPFTLSLPLSPPLLRLCGSLARA